MLELLSGPPSAKLQGRPGSREGGLPMACARDAPGSEPPGQAGVRDQETRRRDKGDDSSDAVHGGCQVVTTVSAVSAVIRAASASCAVTAAVSCRSKRGQHLLAASHLAAVAGELVQRVVLDRLEVRAASPLAAGAAARPVRHRRPPAGHALVLRGAESVPAEAGRANTGTRRTASSST